MIVFLLADLRRLVYRRIETFASQEEPTRKKTRNYVR